MSFSIFWFLQKCKGTPLIFILVSKKSCIHWLASSKPLKFRLQSQASAQSVSSSRMGQTRSHAKSHTSFVNAQQGYLVLSSLTTHHGEGHRYDETCECYVVSLLRRVIYQENKPFRICQSHPHRSSNHPDSNMIAQPRIGNILRHMSAIRQGLPIQNLWP